jgi:hypothetical protein
MLLGAVAHTGCSSTATGSGSSPSSSACSTSPVAPAQDAFCTALSSYDGRCGHCEDCTAKNLQNCTKIGATASDAYRNAFVACKDAAPCEGDPHTSACVKEKMAIATPTPAQEKAKAAYCNACNGTNARDCASFFSVNGPSGTNALGYNILLYSDTVAMMAVTTCSSTCDPFKYAVCVALLSCGPSGGDFCADGGLCAPH